MSSPRCEEIIKEAWQTGEVCNPGSNVSSKISICSEKLAQWNKKEFGHIGRAIKQCRERLEALEARHNDVNGRKEIYECKMELDELLRV